MKLSASVDATVRVVELYGCGTISARYQNLPLELYGSPTVSGRRCKIAARAMFSGTANLQIQGHLFVAPVALAREVLKDVSGDQSEWVDLVNTAIQQGGNVVVKLDKFIAAPNHSSLESRVNQVLKVVRQYSANLLMLYEQLEFPSKPYAQALPSTLNGDIIATGMIQRNGKKHELNSAVMTLKGFRAEIVPAGFSSFRADGFEAVVAGSLKVERVEEDGALLKYERDDNIRLNDARVQLMQVVLPKEGSTFTCMEVRMHGDEIVPNLIEHYGMPYDFDQAADESI